MKAGHIPKGKRLHALKNDLTHQRLQTLIVTQMKNRRPVEIPRAPVNQALGRLTRSARLKLHGCLGA